MILNLKPQVINVLAKTWFIKTRVFLYINTFANTCIKNTQFNLLPIYVAIDQSKTVFKLTKDKKEIVVSLLAVVSVDGCPESKVLYLRYLHLQLLIQTSQFIWEVGTDC